MITTCLYSGQGLGNQLWSWAVTTSIAIDNGFDWGIQAPWRFKAKSFMSLDMGKRVIGIARNRPYPAKILGVDSYYVEKRTVHAVEGYDISEFDPELTLVKDGTKVDGNFQSEDYILNHRARITNAFSVQNPNLDLANTCVIHFRGGDFAPHASLLLPQQYYRRAMNLLKKDYRDMRFLIITNDIKLARSYFGQERIVSNYSFDEVFSGPDSKIDLRVASDLSLLQNAPFLILSNSSFSWWGAWTNTKATAIIAPKYWARHNANDGYWSTAGIITRGWRYLDADGIQWSYDDCQDEFRDFRNSEAYMFRNP